MSKLLIVNNKHTCAELLNNIPQRNYPAVTNWFGVFNADFEQILHIVLVTSLLPLNEFYIFFWCLLANFEYISRIALVYLLLILNKSYTQFTINAVDT